MQKFTHHCDERDQILPIFHFRVLAQLVHDALVRFIQFVTDIRLMLMGNEGIAANRLKNGMQNIEVAVITTARERRIAISEGSFVWNSPHAQGRLFIAAHVISNARVASLVLPRECYEESANGVKRVEVWDAIHACVNALAGSSAHNPREPEAAINAS